MALSDTNNAVEDELLAIRRAASGDHSAFADLVRRYEQRIYLYLRQMIGNAELAHDLTQETFLAAYRGLARWQPPERLEQATAGQAMNQATDLLSPWLYRIATNRAISLLRTQAVAMRKTPPSPEPPENVSLEDAIIGRELLRAALKTLDEDDAACLVLHYVAGERYGEIATRLDISSEAVRKRVGRALTALRKAYLTMENEAQS